MWPRWADRMSTSELVSRLAEEAARLVHDELQLAKVEVVGKAKRAGIGAGLFSVAGVLAFYGGACFVAASVLALAPVLSGWLAAVVGGAAVMALAGIFAIAGRRTIRRVPPPLPTEAIDGLRADLRTVLAHAKPGGSA